MNSEFVRKPLKSDFIYNYVFYTPDEVERARLRGQEALDEMRIRDTWLKRRALKMGVALSIRKDPYTQKPVGRMCTCEAVDIDPDDFKLIPVEELAADLEAQRLERAAARAKTVEHNRRIKASKVWHRPEKLADRFVLVGDQVHEVRYRDPLDEKGEPMEREFEVAPYPVRSNTVQYKGKRHTVVQIRNRLSGGAMPPRKGGRVKGSGKPRFKAQLRVGSKVHHLGMFDTVEERDHAVRVAKVNLMLGLSVYPSP